MARKRKRPGTPQPEHLAKVAPTEGIPLPPESGAAGEKPPAPPAPKDHPLELVANVAARLVDPNLDFPRAARNALALLDACKAALAGRAEEAKVRALTAMADSEIPPDKNFKDGVLHVTEIRDFPDAEKAFEEFIAYFIRRATVIYDSKDFFLHPKLVSDEDNYLWLLANDPGDAELQAEREQVQSWLAKLRESGIPGWRACEWRRMFPAWRGADLSLKASNAGKASAAKRQAEAT